MKIPVASRKLALLGSLAFVSLAALPIVLDANASSIVYTGQYIPSALPQSTAGTELDPQWYFYTANAETNTASVSNYILSASTSASVGIERLQLWQLGQDFNDAPFPRPYGSPATSWEGNSLIGSTVDFTVRVTAASYDSDPGSPGGFQIFIGDEDAGMNVFFTPTGISAVGGGSYSVSGRDNTEFQTYRLVIKYLDDAEHNRVFLYEAGNESPIFQYMAPSGANGLNYVNFGTSTSGTSGTWDLAFLGWSNDVAEFSAPDYIAPIPEPSVGVLAGLALSTLLGLRFRRRRAD